MNRIALRNIFGLFVKRPILYGCGNIGISARKIK